VTKRSLFLILLVAVTLPCVEMPEWLTRCEDPSNDFVLMTPKPEAVSFQIIEPGSLPQSQRAGTSRRSLLPHPALTSELPSVTGPELLIFFSLQRE